MKEKVLSAILYILAGASALYGAAVVTIIGTGSWFNFAFFIISAGLVSGSVLLKLRARLPRWFKRGALGLLCVFFGLFIAFEIRIISFGAGAPAKNADYVIVLGAKVNGTEPSLEYAARLRAAASYLKDNPDARCITTGGMGRDEGLSEGASGKNRLVALGIDSDRILTEEKSESTEENFRFAAGIMRADGGDPAESSVVVVSSSFHLYRAGFHARAEGFENVSYLGSRGLKVLLPQYYLREFAAFAKEYIL